MASGTLYVDRRTSDHTREILAKLLVACLIIYLNYHLWCLNVHRLKLYVFSFCCICVFIHKDRFY